jgi:AraC-like DNA-binding protein
MTIATSPFNKWTISFPLPSPIAAILKSAGHTHGVGILSHTEKTFASAMKLPPVQAEEFLGLHFNLGTKLGYAVKGISGVIKTCQYNFIYVPASECEIVVQKGTYESLRIQFPPEYFEALRELFPILDSIRERVALKQPVAVSANHINCSPEITQEIKYLLEAKSTDHTTESEVSDMAFEIIKLKGSSLLIACLFDLEKKANQLISRDTDKQKVELARSYILDHLNERFSADKVARKAEMQEYKLRKDFKAMYKSTMLKFHRHARLEKAKALLANTDLSVESIGRAIGSNNLPHFSNSFKKKYGYSPREFRDKLRSGSKEN